MAIPVVDLLMSLRYALGDMQGMNISDYELIEPINQAASKLYGVLSQRYVHAAVVQKGPLQIDPTSANKTVTESITEETIETGGATEIDYPTTFTAGKTYILPDNFIRIHQVLGVKDDSKQNDENEYCVIIPTSGRAKVFGVYRIVGRELSAAKGWYVIEYYYVPSKIKTVSDTLDVPESMRQWIEQIALAMYKKDYATADGLIMQCESVLAGREISHFENMTPSQVLGGRPSGSGV